MMATAPLLAAPSRPTTLRKVLRGARCQSTRDTMEPAVMIHAGANMVQRSAPRSQFAVALRARIWST